MVKYHTIYQCKFQINWKFKCKNENIGVLEKKMRELHHYLRQRKTGVKQEDKKERFVYILNGKLLYGKTLHAKSKEKGQTSRKYLQRLLQIKALYLYMSKLLHIKENVANNLI